KKNVVASSEDAGVADSLKKPTKPKLALFDKHVEKESSVQTDTKGFQAFLTSYREVLKSKVYSGAVVARVLDVLAYKGYMVFLPKYLENHYGIPQYKVHLYMALYGVLGFASGTVLGGVLTRWLRLNGRVAAFFVLFISIFNTSLFFGKSLLGCHSVVNSVGLAGQTTNFNYTKACNSECGCESAKLFPVCDAEGRVFYSPCHAGCRHVSVLDIDTYNMEFSECDCVAGGVVKKEFCHDNCGTVVSIFFATMFIGAFVAGTGMVPGMLLLLRSVPPATRSISLGLHGFLVSLLGTLPSPILWGSVIDSACLIWDQVCGGQGTCSIYDPEKLRIRMHYMYCALRFISMLIDIFVWYHAKGINLQEEEEKTLENQAETEATKE
ncbi:Protein F47E1.2, partial [Aphelenchoides avenae]